MCRASVPLIVMAGADYQPAGWVLSLAAFGGAISYPVYAVHMPVFLWFEYIQNNLGILMSPKIRVFLETIVALSVAFALLKLYDEPVRAYLARRTRAKSRLRTATEVVIGPGDQAAP
jgi:peptidoglycan/LPS O-acetylase OafA/YrhL